MSTCDNKGTEKLPCQNDNHPNESSSTNNTLKNELQHWVCPPIILYSANLIQKLSSDDIRLPSTSIGVRRVRPSSKITQLAFKHDRRNNSSTSTPTNTSHEIPIMDQNASLNGSSELKNQIVYKVKDENGKERRMTNQEKKKLKLKLRQERYEQKKRLKQQQQHEQQLPAKDSLSNENQITHKQHPEIHSNHNKRYYQLPLNQESIRTELAELRGDRGIPPIILSPAVATRALQMGVLPPSSQRNQRQAQVEKDQNEFIQSLLKSSSDIKCRIHDGLASKWAKLIKDDMKHAESIRSNESIRPMAYQLVPEVWTRLRPSLQEENLNGKNRNDADSTTEAANNIILSNVTPDEKNCVTDSTSASNDCEWAFLPHHAQISFKTFIPVSLPNHGSSSTKYHPTHLRELDKILIFQQLHNMPNIQISCGAKFGCDYLLYKGNREEQHAFAGLRVISSPDSVSIENKTNTNTVMNEINNNRSCQDLNETKTESNHQVINENKNKEGIDYLCDSHLFPIPSAYDLAGYVRGLNTAGKLALLATVIRIPRLKRKAFSSSDEVSSEIMESYVAIVDLALEKILSAPTHQRKRQRGGGRKSNGTTKRKNVGLNLKKSKK